MTRPSPFGTLASREFTDRGEPLRRFEEALDQPQGPEAYRVLVWYGVGGQGKTALCTRFHDLLRDRQSRDERLAKSVLDFAVPRYRSPVAGLLRVRLDLGARRGVAFPTFDLAFAQLFGLEHPGDDLRESHPALFREGESELLADLLRLFVDGAKLLPFPGAALLYKYGHRLAGRLRDWWVSREVKPFVAEIERLSASRLRERLPAYLGFDLRRALGADEPPRVVLLVDAYEALWRDAPAGAMRTLRTDEWVRSLVESAPGALVALFCRDKLRWGDLNPKWNRILEQHLLGGLSDEDADRFLEKAGLTSSSTRRRIVHGARGLPFYLDLALDTFETVRAEGRDPVDDDFAGTPGEVLERFLDHLSEAEMDDLRLASYPEEIDEKVLGDLCRQFYGGAATADWARLAQRSYMTTGDDGRTLMHAIMRDTLQAREQAGRGWLYREVHEWLFRRFEAEADGAEGAHELGERHERALLSAARHLAQAAPERLPAWILEPRWQKFYHAGRWRALEGIFGYVGGTVEALPAGARGPEAVWLAHQHAHICQVMGRDEEAKPLFERALGYYREAGLDEGDPDHATILQALADVSRATGADGAAESLYVKAIEIYEAAPGRHERRHAEAVFNLAGLQEARGRQDEAEALYERARALFAGLEADRGVPYANFLLKLARARLAKGRDEEAEAGFREALEVYRTRAGEQHAGYAVTLLDLSGCLARRGEQGAAAVEMERAVETHREAFGPEHPNLGRALHLQAVFWADSGRPRPEVLPQLARAVEILEGSLGEEHVWSREALADLRRLEEERR